MSRTQLVARLRAIFTPARAPGPFDLKRLATRALTVLVCALLLIVFQHLSRAVDYKSVIHALRMMTPAAWAAALFATGLSFAALVERDFIGLRHIGVTMPRSLLWVGATVGSALGNVTGFGALTGGAVRCRVYGAADVTPAQVGRLSIFTGATLALSLAFMAAFGMLFSADTLSGMMHLSPALLEAVGAALLAVFAGDAHRFRTHAAHAAMALEVAVVYDLDAPRFRCADSARRRRRVRRGPCAVGASAGRGARRLRRIHDRVLGGDAAGHDRPYAGRRWRVRSGDGVRARRQRADARRAGRAASPIARSTSACR